MPLFELCKRASKPLAAEPASKEIYASMMTAAEAYAAPTSALLLVCNSSPQRCQSHELDGSVISIDSEKRCEIFTETDHSVLQLTER